MSNEYDRVNAFVDRLLAAKRSRSFRATPEEFEAIQVAIWLRAARLGSDLPDPAFLERLSLKLSTELGEVENEGGVVWCWLTGAFEWHAAPKRQRMTAVDTAKGAFLRIRPAEGSLMVVPI